MYSETMTIKLQNDDRSSDTTITISSVSHLAKRSEFLEQVISLTECGEDIKMEVESPCDAAIFL